MKLLTYFLVIAVLVAAVGFVGYYSTNQIRTGFDAIADENAPSRFALTQIQAQVNKLHQEAISFALIHAKGQAAAAAEELEELEEAKKRLEFWESEYEKLAEDEEEQGFVEQIEEQEVALYETTLALITATKENKTEQEILDKKEELEVKEETITQLMDTVIEKESEEFKELREIADKTSANMTLIILIISAAAIIFSIGLGLFISKRITKPLEKLTKTVDEVSKGNFNAEIGETGSIKEINVLAASLSRVMKTMKLAVLEKGPIKIVKESPQKISVQDVIKKKRRTL